MNVWEIIDTQKEDALSASNEDIKSFINRSLDEKSKKYFNESWDKKLPIEYHTEASCKPAHHFLSLARSMIYFNPRNLANKSLKEESIKWFGMSIDMMGEMVNQGWIIIRLDEKAKYTTKAQEEIEHFFKKPIDSGMQPIYVRLADDYISSYLGKGSFEEYFNELEKESYIEKKNEGWKKILNDEPCEIFGVKITVDKIRENYIKLSIIREFLDKYLKDNNKYKTIEIIDKAMEGFEPANDKTKEEICRHSYTAFLLYGTPILYCDLTGYVSVGSEPYWHIYQSYAKDLFYKMEEKIKSRMQPITSKNEHFVYFDDIKKPYEVITNHYNLTRNILTGEKLQNVEKTILDMSKKIKCRIEEKESWDKAFKSYEEELEGKSSKEARKISFPLNIGATVAGTLLSGNIIIGGLIGLSSLLVDPLCSNITLKRIVGTKAVGIEIEEKQIPSLKLDNKLPFFKDVHYRVFKIPYEDYSPEKLKLVQL